MLHENIFARFSLSSSLASYMAARGKAIEQNMILPAEESIV